MKLFLTKHLEEELDVHDTKVREGWLGRDENDGSRNAAHKACTTEN